MDDETRHASTAHDTAHAATDALTLGDYVLSARLARRPSADVYEATHAPTGAPRLVYVLRPGAMQDHPLVHRVVCEVDAARWLRHPAIAKVDGYGDTPSRRLYLGVERAPGRTLRELLADGERIAAWRVARLASRLVEALDEAHAVGLTHGHLTPDVVVLAPEAEAAGSPPLVTLVGLGAGAVAFDGPVAAADRPYLSPEQLAGGDADARSDVFGLASLLHHLLAGQAPAEVTVDGADAHTTPSDGGHRPTAAVLAAARAADPRRRPASVKAFWEELLAALVADAAAAASLGPHAPVATPRAAAPAVLDADVLQALELEVLDLEVEPAVWSEPTPAALPVPAPVPVPVAVAPVPAPVAPPAPPVYPTERPAPLRPRQYDRDDHVAPPVVSAIPSRRRRVLVAIAWCVAVPAVAAAVGWPLAYGGSPARDARMGETAVEILADAPPPPAVPSSTDSLVGPAPKAQRPALPAVPTVDIPAVDLPTVDVASRRPLVRAEEFTKRITSADSLR
ncbi:protein kinase domain-containing protein [Roseisolibacter agri]|uniref:Protein kinase domain-containing protein n=1 Tax=Roseisolibacter agri TaxID=2014610 RepID=A0AA37Q2N3_9BACT|nr:hypothetical protein [Roseisolibacter agri]GLC25460.1 hypothetical protein rosag_19730 [Roseisolibacter agri]